MTRSTTSARVDLLQLVRAQAPFLQHPGAEVLDHHVGLGDQPAQDVLALGLAEVQGDGSLVPGDHLPPQAVPSLLQAVGAGRVPAGMLDLDHVGAPVAEQHRGDRARRRRCRGRAPAARPAGRDPIACWSSAPLVLHGFARRPVAPPRGTAHSVTDPATTRPPALRAGRPPRAGSHRSPYFATPTSGTLVERFAHDHTDLGEAAHRAPQDHPRLRPRARRRRGPAAGARQPGDRAARGDHGRRQPDPREGHPQRAGGGPDRRHHRRAVRRRLRPAAGAHHRNRAGHPRRVRAGRAGAARAGHRARPAPRRRPHHRRR